MFGVDCHYVIQARTKLLQEGRNLSGQERRDLEYKARLEEMEMRQDRNLDSISGAVKDLKGMSQMMRDELNVQVERCTVHCIGAAELILFGCVWTWFRIPLSMN